MKRIVLTILGALLVAHGGVAAVAADHGNGKGNGPPATVPGSPGDDCSHGNSGKDCRPDPQPEHGKECDDHGNARGNEDHCGPVDTTPDETTPDETTPDETTPVETTPVETTPEVTTSTPETISTPTASTPEPTAPSTTTSTTPVQPPAAKPPVAKVAKKAAKAKATKVVAVAKKANGVVVVTTADGRKHVGIMGSG
jgi:cell division septation protein DedD